MGIKSWLFGKDREDKDSKKEKQQRAVATIKKQLNSLEVQGKNLQRKADEQKQMARDMLRSGNKIGAKQALTRSKIYLQKQHKVENMKLNLQSQIDAIQDIQGTAETVKALKESTSVVKETLDDMSALDVERTMAEMEDQRDQIDMINESLADTTALEMSMDIEFADSIDDELASMEMELQGELPDAGTKTTATSQPEQEDEESMEDLEEELEALQKELDGSE